MPGSVQQVDAPIINVLSGHAVQTPAASKSLNVPISQFLQPDWPCKSLNLPVPQFLQAIDSSDNHLHHNYLLFHLLNVKVQ